MLLRVPPASIRALGDFGQTCAKRGVPYNAVIAKLGFDMESPTPKLIFKPLGMLDEQSFAQVQEVANSDTVASILGKVGSPDALPAPVAKAEAPELEEAPAPKVEEAPAPKVEEAPAPKKKVSVASVDVSDLNLDDLNFDD
jgi:pyruvate/2-oxoglutarate dehydrogenase complex dihydrolipoamide acyltransferase (E2) component